MDIMTDNPGIEWDTEQWPSVAYKGGSEVGVLYTAWLMERHDGRQFVLCFGINDPSAAIDTDRCIGVLKAVGALLARVD